MQVLAEHLKLRVLLLGLTLCLASCTSYFPGQKSYWDSQVKELCERDGGSTVYEVIELTQEQYKSLGGFDGGLPVPELRADRPGYPYVREWSETRIRESNPEVIQ